MIRHVLTVLLLAGLLLFALVVAGGCSGGEVVEEEEEAESTDERDGFASAEDVVAAYFAAALANDVEALVAVVRPDQRHHLEDLDAESRDPAMDVVVDYRYDEQMSDEDKVLYATTLLDADGGTVMEFPFHVVRHEGRWYWDISDVLLEDEADSNGMANDAATAVALHTTAESLVTAYFAAALAHDVEVMRVIVRPDQRHHLDDVELGDRDPALEHAVDYHFEVLESDDDRVVFDAAFLDVDGNSVLEFPFLAVRLDGYWYWDMSYLLDEHE